MDVEIHMLSQSQPIKYSNVLNTYTKDGMFCVMFESREVHKYPLTNTFRVKEYEKKKTKKQ